MKKLALLVLLVATPAIACPDMDSSSDHAPKTAEKDKKDNKTADKTPAKDSKTKEAPKTEKAPAPSKDTAKAKTAKPDPKKPANDKVSQK